MPAEDSPDPSDGGSLKGNKQGGWGDSVGTTLEGLAGEPSVFAERSPLRQHTREENMAGVDSRPWVQARAQDTRQRHRETVAEELESLCLMFGRVALKGPDGVGDVHTDAGARVRAILREMVAYVDEYGVKAADVLAGMRKAAYGSYEGSAAVNIVEGGT